ncbi:MULTISPECIES: tripartite tricarboxylate transporter TctB family protein [Nesterenkonia]|uniref:DUF1468 domain-containing protein n=1 Tax=Nesterenkonia xinjiangensis TaxID=225327 RepID=A0A7Z0GJN1_9MICC|nr:MULTISPECIES: tripartite tricarboxylate transporter TctB family protein [Nesterenkonia]MDZ5076692.1 tripartite tricarboxylate transporter TctB family protein [Nesterenkonia sp. HG001]NYJ77222.1 hypothetical protein [Nesterenkonia xinjiangensis]
MTTAHETQEAREVSEGGLRIAVGLLGLAAFCYYTWDAGSMPVGQMAMPGPGFFPLLIGAFGVLSSIIVIVDALFKLRQETTVLIPSGGTARRLGGLILLLTLFVLAIDVIGTYLGSILFCSLSIKLLSSHAWWRCVVYGTTMAVVCVFLFDTLLNVSLPGFGLW